MGLLVRTIAAAALAIFGQLPPAHADDYQTRSLGGPGGAPFTMRCAQGDYLVGLRARSGDWVDAIAPFCARWDEGRQAFLPPGLGPMRGGAGGAASEIRCDQVSAIRELLIEHAPNQFTNVALLVPACAAALDPGRRTARIGSDQFGTSVADRLARDDDPGVGSSTSVDYNWSLMPRCNAGDLAVGVYGAAGVYLDRIGLICAPAPSRPFILPPILPTLPTAGPNSGPDFGGVAGAASAPRCRDGFVWREASPADLVCVTPQSRARVRQENAQAYQRIDPRGAYGPASCIPGYVWREAFDGDLVCVTPAVRALVARENREAPTRTLP